MKKIEQLDVFFEQNSELKEKFERANFRIGLFGGSSHKESVEQAKQIAYELTKKWFPVETGGYAKGVMGSALEGAEQALEEMKKDPEVKKYLDQVKPYPKGVVIENIKPEQAQKGEYIKTELVDDFFARKRDLITSPKAFIIFEGGMGTGAEITDAIQHNLKLKKLDKPIIFVGGGNTKHEQLLNLYREDITEDKTKENIYFIEDPEVAPELVERLYLRSQTLEKSTELDPELESELDKYRIFKEKKEQ